MSLTRRHNSPYFTNSKSGRQGHRTILKLDKDSGAELTSCEGPIQYRINGAWIGTDDGFQITFCDDLVCKLTRDGDAFVIVEVKRLSVEDSAPALEGPVTEPQSEA